jgi:acetyl esterase/lipase
MGTSPGRPASPVLLGVGNADGTDDGIMIAGDVEALAHEYCQRGVPVTFEEYPGLEHSEAAVPCEAAALTFLEARFAGLPQPGDCVVTGKGNSLAPLPEPSS